MEENRFPVPEEMRTLTADERAHVLALAEAAERAASAATFVFPEPDGSR